MSAYDPFDLLGLPLSAYTPGQGNQSMEGGWETASGAPVYTYEMWQRGAAPYVTGATNAKTPSNQLVYRSMGDQSVPVRITDYGPGVKGIDIASSNKKWANNFPFQGQTDVFDPNKPAPAVQSMPPAVVPPIIPTPVAPTPGIGDGMGYAGFAAQNVAQSPTGWASIAGQLGQQQGAGAGAGIGGAIAGILGGLGKSIAASGQQSGNQAMQMMAQHQSPLAGYLRGLLSGGGNNYPDYSQYFG